MTTTDRWMAWMIARDLPQVAAIERTLPDPWTDADFLTSLRKRNNIGMVLRDQTFTVYGYVLYALGKATVTVLRLAVRPDLRRTGIGRALVDKLKDKVVQHHRDRLVLDVPEAGLGTQLFLRACGLAATATLPGVYRFEYGHPDGRQEPPRYSRLDGHFQKDCQ